jgi:glycosyltransferase involved in cell wall biosynthesis
MSRISVCITHYNRPEKLGHTLESLARQTRPPDEVFLQDDCSPLDPARVAESFKGRFKKFVYERNPSNIGMPGNLNRVLAKATGDLIANLHDADEFHPNLLERWENVLARHPSAGLAFCGYDALTKSRHHKNPGKIWIQDFAECTNGLDFFERVYVGASSSPIWGTVMVRKDVYEKHLPFDARFGSWADVDMWMRICGTHDIAYVNEPLIVLDNSETHARTFHWQKVLTIHAMHFANIKRLARSASERGVWLRKQQYHSAKAYMRHLLARLGRGDLRRVAEGVREMPKLATLLVGG